jgi:ATP-dependent DNA ligase
LDGYRAIAIKSGGRVRLRSRNDKDFAGKYPLIARAFAGLPDETVVDGEIVALDENGRPSFNLLQNAGTSKQPIFFYAFDVPILAGRDLMHEPLDARRTLLRTEVLSRLADPIRYSPVLNASLPDRYQLDPYGRTCVAFQPGECRSRWRCLRDHSFAPQA